MYTLNSNKGTNGLYALLELQEVQKSLKIITRRETKTTNRYFAYEVDTLVKILKGKITNKKCYHEIIPAVSRQKMKYDIDYYPNPEDGITLPELIDKCCETIMSTFSEIGNPIEPKDLIILDSSNSEKYSMHILVNKYYMNTNIEAARLFELTVSNADSKIKDALDKGVYSSNQSFRMVNCFKIGTDRKFSLLKEWKFKGEKIILDTHIDPIILTFATCVTGCDEIKIPIKLKETPIDKTLFENLKVSDLEIERVVELRLENAFKVSRNENYFDLLRTKPSVCIACNREHEKENARIYCNQSGLYYRCWRTQASIKLESVANLNINDSFEDDKKVNISDQAIADMVKRKINIEQGVL